MVPKWCMDSTLYGILMTSMDHCTSYFFSLKMFQTVRLLIYKCKLSSTNRLYSCEAKEYFIREIAWRHLGYTTLIRNDEHAFLRLLVAKGHSSQDECVYFNLNLAFYSCQM